MREMECFWTGDKYTRSSLPPQREIYHTAIFYFLLQIKVSKEKTGAYLSSESNLSQNRLLSIDTLSILLF
jgi:hypothetical protein